MYFCPLAFLCSNVDLDGSTIGIAFLSVTCGSSAVGVTQDTRRPPASVGATASHELGHIMNMDHDDAGESRPVTSSHCLSQFLSGDPRVRVSTVCMYWE